MPKNVTIRNVPTEVADELAARADATGRSLQEYVLRHLIEWASQPDPEVMRARMRRHAERHGVSMTGEEIVRLIKEGRDPDEDRERGWTTS